MASRSQTHGSLIKSRVLSLMYTNSSWVYLNDLFFCVCLFAVQEMEERIHHFETFLWAGKARQVDPDQLGTTKTHKLNRESHRKNTLGQAASGALPLPPREETHSSWGFHRCYRLRNLARSRPILHNQTSGGASVTHARTPSRWWATPGATRVLTFIHAARSIT